MSKTAIMPECGKELGMKEISVTQNEKKEGAIGLLSKFLRFESLKRSPESPAEPPTTYYGVYIPCEIKKGPDEEALHVYKTKAQAMELVKRYKMSRFKTFRNYQEAVSFALRGADTTDTVDGNDNTVMGEKPYPFKAPSPQDMVSLRKTIEAGLTAAVRDRVWDNPRYLVSSGNTPSILQEGSRYNALHVAAKAKNAEICNLILTTVGDPTFVHTLYGGDSDIESCKEFALILLDRYLNTPDKSMNETPLHFAVKFGADDVVDVLTSFSQCNKEAVNKFGEQPKNIICQRVRDHSTDVAVRIESMLKDRYYVPVLHSEDNSSPPTIGRPFTPSDPPCINNDPLSPRYEIRAFAGPMDSAAADTFRKRWKTPPRSRTQHFRLKEMTKGLENQGRNLAEQLRVGWKEYWPFLDTFTDLRTTEGLNLLENYLKAKYECGCSFAYIDSRAQSQILDPVLSLSLTNTFSQQNSSTPVKDLLSPMSELCVAIKNCKLSETPSHWKKTDPIRQRLCRQPIKCKTPTNGDAPIINHTVSQLLCIDRTCQVFAKRIADALNFSLTAELEVAGESLKNEAKHLQHTINTYMDDERFSDINFGLIHSRLAQLVVAKLKQQTKDLDDINTLVEFLDKHSPITYKGPNRIKVTIDSHVKCLAGCISRELSETGSSKGPAVSENECVVIWENVKECVCDWKVEHFERQGRKSSSFRSMKNRSTLSTGSNDGFIRRLTFDQDIGDGREQRCAGARPLSVNSPAGDADPSHSLPIAEISSDETSSESEEEHFTTASEHSESEDEAMHDASDRALVEPFIYGEEPTKVDRLVWDAISSINIDRAQFPNIARWKHTVALYTPSEREQWKPVSLDDSISSCNTSMLCSSPIRPREDVTCSTPTKCTESAKTLPLQMSNWLRVTGPNSPRAALASKTIGHNVSFGF